MSLMSLMSPMRKILFAVIGLSLLSGCMDMDDATQPVTTVVQLERPSGFVNLTDLSGHTVTLKSATETMTAVTDASGRATFTDLAPDHQAHFVLYDDASTITAKLRTAESCGVDTAFLLYSEVADLLPEICAE